MQNNLWRQIYRNYVKDEKLPKTSSVESDSCGRIKDKVVIVMVATVRPGDEESIKLAYACVVYDLKKGKITSGNLLDTFCREEDGYTLDNPQIIVRGTSQLISILR